MSQGFLVPIRSTRSAAIEPVALGQSGLAYARKQLSDAAPLARVVSNLWGNQGLAFAPLEKGATLERAEKLETGSSEPTDAIRKWLADYISSKWSSSQLVFEDSWTKPSDLKLHPPEQPYFFIEETPYYAPQGKDLFTQLITGELETASWLYAAYVISPRLFMPASGLVAGQAFVELLAQNIQAVLVSAYDHEGYVVWER